MSQTSSEQPKETGPRLANANAVKHGLYRAKSKDAIKAQRIRRRVNRRLQGVPSQLRPVMRHIIVAMVEIEDRLEVMRDYLYTEGLTNPQGEPRRMVSEYRHYWGLWMKLASAKGMILASFMATSEGLAPRRCAGPTTLGRRCSVVKNPVEFTKDVLGINLYPLQAIVANNTKSINSTYFIPGNLFVRPRSQPSAYRK